MPVESQNRNYEARPQGRVTIPPTDLLQRWCHRLPILRWVRALPRRLRLNSAPVTVVSDTKRSRKKYLGNEVLTVVSANLWHDWPRFRKLPQRLENLAQMIETQGAQVVLLQEASQTPNLFSSAWLADRLNMTHAYVRANGHQEAIGFEEGTAVLTSFPMSDVRALPLRSSAAPFVRRMALGARLELGCCQFWVVSTHLGFLRRDNQRQLAALHSWVETLAGSETAVIGGDFNAGEGSQAIAAAQSHWQDTYRSLYPEADGNTHQLEWPWGGIIRRQRLDYLFLHAGANPWHVTDAQHLATKPLAHSDHKAVLTRLRYNSSHEHLIQQN